MLEVAKAHQVLPLVLERLREDHARSTRVLRVLEWEVDRLSVLENPDCSLLASIVEYLRSYSDTVHHPTEDRLFDRLLQNGLTLRNATWCF